VFGSASQRQVSKLLVCDNGASMMKTKSLSIFIVILAALVLVGVVLSHLALTDINHGIEPNLEMEWWIVRITFILVILLAVSSMYFAIKISQIES
jgi:heme/copper-type cytochrome/quinol oxidase subunit 2